MSGTEIQGASVAARVVQDMAQFVIGLDHAQCNFITNQNHPVLYQEHTEGKG